MNKPVTKRKSLTRTAKFLLATKACRSIGQGALVVDFALYLHTLHWDSLQIGILYSGSLLAGAIAILLIGPTSDRYGAKKFLLAYELAQIGCALIAIDSTGALWLSIAAIVGTFGHGAAGGAGPFSPAEQSWLSRSVRHEAMGLVFRWNAGIGFFGMGTGAILGGIPDYVHGIVPPLLSFRFMFVLVLIGAIATLFLLKAAEDQEQGITCQSNPDIPVARELGSNSTPPWRTLLTLSAINTLNGVEIGMIGPLMAYWFAIRFGAAPSLIGAIMGIGFMSAGAMAFMGGYFVSRWGNLQTVIFFRTLGLASLILLPFMPTFLMAGICFIFRATLNQGSLGSRQTLYLSLVSSEYRGLAASMNSVSIQIPRAIGPSISAALMQIDQLRTPFFIAGGFQAAYIILYKRFFGMREQASPAGLIKANK